MLGEGFGVKNIHCWASYLIRTTARGEGFGVKNIHCWASYLIRTTARGEGFGENKLLGRGLVSRTSTAGRGVSLRWYKWGTMMEEALK
jgi:hypothetical protein